MQKKNRVKHFGELLRGIHDQKRGEDKIELTNEEIEVQLGRPRKRKTAEKDGVPKEAWQNCQDGTREKLRNVLKSV